MKTRELLISDKNYVVVSHKCMTHPDDDLVAYLNENHAKNVLFITHSFFISPDRRSKLVWYKNGNIYKTAKSKDYCNLPEALLYIKEFFFTFYWIVSSKLRYDLYVGLDGLVVIFGIFLRLTTVVRKVAFWAIDLVPDNRFAQEWKNLVYRKVNVFSYAHSDEVWDLSPRMADARVKFLGINESKFTNRRLVPYGVWLQKIRRFAYSECDHSIVFMGTLLPKQGVQEVLKALPLILKSYPKVMFKIIGGGTYEDDLTKLANSLGVADRCVFMGLISSDDYYSVLLPEIAKSAIAIAPYVKELDNWTYFADPGKIKTYLACGVPVVLTNLPWNVQEIVDNNCGMLTTGEPEDIANSCIQLMDSKVNQIYRANALKYSMTFDYSTVFHFLGNS